MNLVDNFEKKFGNSFSQKIKLANYSWFNLGGNAEYFFKPKDNVQLLEFLDEAKRFTYNISKCWSNIYLEIWS